MKDKLNKLLSGLDCNPEYKKKILELFQERDREMVNLVMKELDLDWKMLPAFEKMSEKDTISLAIRVSKARREQEILKYVKELNMMICRLEKRNPELEKKIVELKDFLI